MSRMFLCALIAVACTAGPAFAQDQGGDNNANNGDNVAADQGDQQFTMTPELYRYLEQMQQYESPRERFNRRAAFKSAQRQMRMASREWYGVSLSRPMASPVPQMGIYSPFWAGTYREPYVWPAHGFYHNYRVTDEGLR